MPCNCLTPRMVAHSRSPVLGLSIRRYGAMETLNLSDFKAYRRIRACALHILYQHGGVTRNCFRAAICYEVAENKVHVLTKNYWLTAAVSKHHGFAMYVTVPVASIDRCIVDSSTYPTTVGATGTLEDRCARQMSSAHLQHLCNPSKPTRRLCQLVRRPLYQPRALHVAVG